MLYYVPLEPYVERYTYFMSAKDGWVESDLKKYGVDFVRIDGNSLGSNTIKSGVVLDACGRSYYAMSQIMELVRLINDGVVTDDDSIFIEDFWHPGVESLFYIRQLKGMHFKIGTFLYAQSVDDTDFTWSMREWMRPIEQGFGNQYDFIFVCSHILRQLCIVAGIARPENIFQVGLTFNSSCLLHQLADMGFKKQDKEDYVIFASRFDDEKDPMFFLDLVEACPDIDFKLVNPRKDRPITSNKEVVDRVEKFKKKDNFEVVNTFDKLTYYTTLSKAKVLFNCANQDWVSFTLLEAVTFECMPLYPIWKDFEYELKGNEKYLYQKRNLSQASEKLHALMKNSYNHCELDSVITRHNNTWSDILKIMEVI